MFIDKNRIQLMCIDTDLKTNLSKHPSILKNQMSHPKRLSNFLVLVEVALLSKTL